MDRRHEVDKKAATSVDREIRHASLRDPHHPWVEESSSHTSLPHPRGTSNQPDITLSLPFCCLLFTLSRNLNCIERLGIVGNWFLGFGVITINKYRLFFIKDTCL